MTIVSAEEKLRSHAQRWRSKRGLRLIYQELFRAVRNECVEGSILEVGGGFGSLKEELKSLISTDIVRMPNLDVVCDTQILPFVQDSFNNVVAVDTLHHLEWPLRFFQQVAGVLQYGGRLILVEPLHLLSECHHLLLYPHLGA